jgi:hypothetical protein
MIKKQLVVTRTRRDHYIPEYDTDIPLFEHIFGALEVDSRNFQQRRELVGIHGWQLVIRDARDAN